MVSTISFGWFADFGKTHYSSQLVPSDKMVSTNNNGRSQSIHHNLLYFLACSAIRSLIIHQSVLKNCMLFGTRWVVYCDINYLQDKCVKCFNKAQLTMFHASLFQLHLKPCLRQSTNQLCKPEKKLCCSRKYPYPSHRRFFGLIPPTPQEIPVKPHGKVCLRAKGPIRPELIPVSVA